MNAALYTLSALAAVAIPPLLAWRGLPWVRSSYGGSHLIFEMFGFSATVALAVVVWRELAKRRGTGLAGAIPVLLFAVVTVGLVLQVSEHTRKMPDYLCYENAAKALEAGRSPYYAPGYMYPPLTAQAISAVHRAMAALGVGAQRSWDLVFYLWQCAQVLLAVAAYLLSVRFARVLGAVGIAGPLIAAAVFLWNGPLIRTFAFNQPNLWMLNAVLFALVFGARYAGTAGALVALGASVKLYPAALVLPMVLARRWRMLAGFVFAGALIAVVGLGSEPRAWMGFLRFAQIFPHGEAFRDNGLYSVVSNVISWLGGSATVTAVLWRIAVTAAGICIALRVIRREQSWAALSKEDGASETGAMLRFTGHVVDVLAFALMAAPIVWEHHYVLAAPLVLWALVTQHSRRPYLVTVGSALMLLPVTVDIFPFGYYRIAGLLMVIAATSPRIDLVEYERNVEPWRKTGVCSIHNS